jgi:ABC-type polysaccharide/polyol phosphate transport system ATPase subunit
LDRPLAAGDRETMARIALTVALECTQARLLILGPLPALTAAGFKQWATGRLTALRGDGAAVVQVVERKGELLGAADRALRIEDGRLTVCGHADSVFLHSTADPELWSAGAQL